MHFTKALLLLMITASAHCNLYYKAFSGNSRLVLGQAGNPRIVRNYTNASNSETTEALVPINFETEENIITGQNYRVKGRPPCDSLEEQGFCAHDPEYNETIVKLFNEIMENAPIHNLITDVLNETIVDIEIAAAAQPHLRNRIGFTTEQTLCPSAETIIYPKRGQTPNKEWVFILNQGPVQQGIKVEKCLKPNASCQLGGGPLEQTACRQKYIYKKLLAMDTSGNNIVSESIYIPSCCVCYVSNDFVSTRTAASRSLPCPPSK